MYVCESVFTYCTFFFQIQQAMYCGQRQKEPVSLLQATKVFQGRNEKGRSEEIFLFSLAAFFFFQYIEPLVFKF